MEWNEILPAIMAGGIVGQLFTLIWGNTLTKKRDYNRWIESERHKLYSEMLILVTLIPKEQKDLDNWTYQIRSSSQRIHILFETGTAPSDFKSALELVFKLAQEKKDDSTDVNWSEQFRMAVRGLRKQMSAHIKVV
jgi:hypothetical protein